MAGERAAVDIDGHRLALTNLRKVLYPVTGTTKAEVIGYFAEAAHVLLPHVDGRPVTRKRWPNGVDTAPFFHKDLPRGTPEWVSRCTIEHSDGPKQYPIVDSPATLAWLGQIAALELHVPQWLCASGAGEGGIGRPNRLVFDLDPGPGVELAQCAEVARWVKARLADRVVVPVTSGSKGIHLYTHLDGELDSGEASALAKDIAEALETDHRDLVTSRMSKAVRPGKVFIDWSQNSAAKTTIAPYSLRGRDAPWVAAPRTWAELADPGLRQLDYREVLDLLDDGPDPMAGLEDGSAVDPETRGGTRRQDRGDGRKLDAYRAKRSAERTPEPVPRPGPLPAGSGNSFVIQEHHARRLHYDLRLERDGVLVSWAVPKGVPESSRENRLAVHTEDHPLEYATFAGDIPHGEYGGGHMEIWDSGTYVTEKWRDHEVIVVLRGQRAKGRYALIRTNGDQWLLHRMKDQSRANPNRWGDQSSGSAAVDAGGGSATGRNTPSRERNGGELYQVAEGGGVGEGGAEESGPRPPEDLLPMLAAPTGPTDTSPSGVLHEDGWRFEGKWDGIRALAWVGPDGLRLISRVGNDFTAAYPELAELSELMDGHTAVLDGEIVALDGGRSSFARLQQRMNLQGSAAIAKAVRDVPVEFWLFDVLWLDGISLLTKKLDDRRRILDLLPLNGEICSVPDRLDDDVDTALAHSVELGWEGIVAKRGDSQYLPGKRSRTWLKIKNFTTVEVVVVGWKPGSGRRAGGIGSLLVAVGDGNGGLRYAGKVGTGFTDQVLQRLLADLEPQRRRTAPVSGTVPRPDARDAVWVEPTLVGEVQYVEWTPDGKLRAPSWRGVRIDKTVDDVRSGP
ncbi:ATP-dependent DNA ligase [Nakamurella flava]|uniref:DNA ligase (ATP) n=1 Tax=Nakamurella flava TaxID=2576308 RepID=A0A4U6QAA8_9ACTN|nr:ATP-dependent DNA ligase [Nakamurella flava]TKV56851.1 ATP-dependent DNA ligase [Nakamurella flava]